MSKAIPPIRKYMTAAPHTVGHDQTLAFAQSVSPDAPLDEVAAAMAEHKYGSAVVMDNEHVVGVFTTVDGMSALSELLQSRLAK